MNRPADEEDIAFVRALIAKAVSAGADEAQATLTYDEGLEVDFDSRRLSMQPVACRRALHLRARRRSASDQTESARQ